MTESTARCGWARQAAARLQSHWLLKSVGITVAITSFMVIYFILLDHPLFPVTMIPETPLDRLIGFHSWSLIPYASLWVYISLVPMLLFLRQEAAPYLSATIVLSLVGFVIFLLWPTAIVQPDLDWSHYPAVAFLKTMDSSGNACPSMHVAFAVLTVLWLQRLLACIGAPPVVRGLNWGWCLLIIWSTLALKQHLAIDVLAGTALGALVGWSHLNFFSYWRTEV